MLVSWQDGLVESVCPHHDDPAWAVNIKRGVLSMLQHTSQFLDVSEKNVVEVSAYITLLRRLTQLHADIRLQISANTRQIM